MGFRTIEDDPFWFRYELLTGRHEAETVNWVRRIVKPGMVALDIGAHAGYYSVLLAKQMKGAGKIFAFEPNPETLEILNKNVGRFKNVTVIPYAVSDAEGTAELFDYLVMSASGSLHYDESIAAVQQASLSGNDFGDGVKAESELKRFSVQTINLDNFLPSIGVNAVDFIKMDIEGAELTALKGMREIIESSSKLRLVMEYNPQALKAVVLPPENAIAEVLTYGFVEAKALLANGSVIDVSDPSHMTALTVSLMGKMGVVNILFEKEDTDA